MEISTSLIQDKNSVKWAENRICELTKVLKLVESQINKRESFEKIYTSKSNGVFQYYTKDNQHRKKYLNKKENQQLLKRVFQNEYLERLLENISIQISTLENTIKFLAENPLSQIYEKTPDSKKNYIENLFASDEEFIRIWKNQKYEPKLISDETPHFITLNNQKVRSKSEMMIANELLQQKIPFFYEYPIKISDSLTIYPDFYCLIPQKRKIVIWEHFGFTDYSEYRESMVFKINHYAKKGFCIGDNLFITVENQKEPLSLQMIKKMITVMQQSV